MAAKLEALIAETKEKLTEKQRLVKYLGSEVEKMKRIFVKLVQKIEEVKRAEKAQERQQEEQEIVSLFELIPKEINRQIDCCWTSFEGVDVQGAGGALGEGTFQPGVPRDRV